MFRTIHGTNLITTCTLSTLYLTFYGLILMPIVGLVQIILTIILCCKMSRMLDYSRKHFTKYLYFLGTFAIVLAFIMLLNTTFRFDHPEFHDYLQGTFFTLLLAGGMTLSFYHLWITKQLKDEEVAHDL